MAKIAGQKNDGFWWRFNQYLLDEDVIVNNTFASFILAMGTFDPAFQAVASYITATAVIPPKTIATELAWAASLSVGLPRQTWWGVTTYDYYDVTTVGTKKVYKKRMQHDIFKFSVDLRAAAKDLRFAGQELYYLSALHRPPPKARVKLSREAAFARRIEKSEQVLAWLETDEAKQMIAARKIALTLRADESKGLLLRGDNSQPGSRGKRRTAEVAG